MPRKRFVSKFGVAVWIASLVLLAVTVTASVRSHFIGDSVLLPHIEGRQYALELATYPGSIDFRIIRIWPAFRDKPYWDIRQLNANSRALSRRWDSEHSVFGFAYVKSSFAGDHFVGHNFETFVPFWFLCLLFAAPLVFAALRRASSSITGSRGGFEVKIPSKIGGA